MFLSVGDSLRVVKAGMSLLCKILSRSIDLVLIILCLLWIVEHVSALEILASRESRCLNGQSRLEESDLLNRNRQRSRIPTRPLSW